jgi:hypothetical protein
MLASWMDYYLSICHSKFLTRSYASNEQSTITYKEILKYNIMKYKNNITKGMVTNGRRVTSVLSTNVQNILLNTFQEIAKK